MFSKILIANRGAIATRAERTFKKMGVTSVAVYSDADRDSLHVENADEAIYLGEGNARATYLNTDKVIAAAKETGAEAIFPGYGFLSESVQFARRCSAEGIVFIGPEPEQMEQFGLKHVARRIAEEAGVPLAPGTGLITTVDEALAAADEIGYPVMLKSTAGGGGIGIKICHDAGELEGAFESARHLVEANFGDGDVFLEKYVERARHVEVQIFGDATRAAAIAERDCSVQRRNQKVVEECPAPNFPDEVRTRMLAAAESLAQSVGYRSAGTVEFLYDEQSEEFYFLEVNTRLQVEHGITEECCGIDLVEWMVREAAGETVAWEELHEPVGHAIEVRLYAEDSGNGFLPATGKVDEVVWPEDARVETWIRKGVEVTSFFDPMLAKIIVHDDTREAALAHMDKVLNGLRVYGVTTNRAYIESLFESEPYREAHLFTHMLDDFHPAEAAIEVLDGGIQATVQDYPGMVGYWAVGVPPLGPMDSYSFRLGNAVLGNDEGAAGLELTMRGGAYRFRCACWFCIAGADMAATLDGEPVARLTAVRAERGSVLRFGAAACGMRAYLLVKGGIDVPVILGSRSTFVDGRFGGVNGRALRSGDVLALFENAEDTESAGEDVPACSGFSVGTQSVPSFGHSWTIGVIVGPLSDGEFLHPEFFDTLTSVAYTVNYDSARTGVRLNGPAPQWAREDGGEAGLHPSNIHDNPYSICALDLTGDQPILLGPDGPSLGGFVCPVVVALSQRWILGQLRPGDEVRFQVLSLGEAAALRERMEEAIATVRSAACDESAIAPGAAGGKACEKAFKLALSLPEPSPFAPDDAILLKRGEGGEALCIRQSGEDALLVEYGPMKLDIALRFRVHVLMQHIEQSDLDVIDLTPGMRSLQVHFDPSKVSMADVCARVAQIDAALPALEDITVPSRIVHLPLSWDDPQTQLAARRYQETTRPDAPWCPSNPEFIRRINGLDSIDDVRRIVFDADYLVLGLGDVYLGAPVATPVDPRHRMVTTKYNPARPWTPENAVGIGGAYLCVYGMEGPGGYQFVGRTTQMWNPVQPTAAFAPGKPWLLDFFDQLRFYPVSADEILELRRDCLHGRFNPRIEETTFNLGDYLRFLKENEKSIARFKEHQEASFQAEHDRWVEQGLDVFVSDDPTEAAFAENDVPDGCEPVNAQISGAVWKIVAAEGEHVEAGDEIVVLESMKMEFPVCAPCAGTVEKLAVAQGALVTAGQMVAAVRPD